MLTGATKKRVFYFASAFFRLIAMLGLIIAYIAVKIAVKPPITWLNILLLCLAISNLLTAIFNLILCGFSATAYHEKFTVQLVCFLLTLLSGGIASTTFTGIGAFTKVLPEEIKNEGIYNTKTFKYKDGKYEDKTKK